MQFYDCCTTTCPDGTILVRLSDKAAKEIAITDALRVVRREMVRAISFKLTGDPDALRYEETEED